MLLFEPVDFVRAFALMFVIEGFLYACFPDHMKRILERTLAMTTKEISITGLIVATIGFIILWAARPDLLL